MKKQELIDDAKARLLIAEHDLPKEAWQYKSNLNQDWKCMVRDTDTFSVTQVRLTPSTFDLKGFKKGQPAFTRKGQKTIIRREHLPIMGCGRFSNYEQFSRTYNDDGTSRKGWTYLDLYRMDEMWTPPVEKIMFKSGEEGYEWPQKPNEFSLAFKAEKRVHSDYPGVEFRIAPEPYAEWKEKFDRGVKLEYQITAGPGPLGYWISQWSSVMEWPKTEKISNYNFREAPEPTSEINKLVSRVPTQHTDGNQDPEPTSEINKLVSALQESRLKVADLELQINMRPTKGDLELEIKEIEEKNAKLLALCDWANEVAGWMIELEEYKFEEKLTKLKS